MYIRDEANMLEGNINRMCVTNNVEELQDMYKWTKAIVVYIESM